MLKNILITSLRNFTRNRSFSLINLVGLSISMSLAMLIIMIVREQLAFDNFHEDSNRIYRVNTTLHDPEWGTLDFASAPLPVGNKLSEEYQYSDHVVRVSRQFYGDAIFQKVNVSLKGLVVDPSFVRVFNFPFDKGDPATALNEARSVVLTQAAAKRIFGDADPLAQTISISRYGDFTVTGVLQELPGKTHFEFEVLCSYASLSSFEKDNVVTASAENWSAYYDNYVYLKLREGEEPEDVYHALAEITRKYCIGLKSLGRDITYDFYLHPLSKITPGPELGGSMGRGMPVFILVFLGVLAAVALVMSIFNFTNLTIARSLSRAREIGVRKVVGAKRIQVFMQFIGESVVFSLIALIFSYLFLQLLKGAFLSLSFNEDFAIGLQEDLSIYIIFVAFAFVVGILAGVLPASYLSAFKPSRVLKDAQNLKIYSRLTFRQILMAAQFTLSVIFVVVVLIVYRQVDFMLTADYGIDQTNTISIRLQGVGFDKLANDVRLLPGVERVGGVSHKLGTWEDGGADYRRSNSDKAAPMRHFIVDESYIQNLALTFVAGRSFIPEQASPDKEVIINETAVNYFGFESPLNAIGQTIYGDSTELRIAGVVRDFHFRPLTNKIGPLALRYDRDKLAYLHAKVDAAQKMAVLASMKTIWKKHDPVHPIDYMTMEQEIDDAYRQSGMKDMVVIVSYITFLIISLACLGMLGMAMYASQVRAKEIGIRKILGATVVDAVLLLSRSFMMIIGIAILIGVPVSFFLGDSFLQDFAYKIEITPMLIGSGILVIFILGMLMVWSQTIRLATSNPAKWIRSE